MKTDNNPGARLSSYLPDFIYGGIDGSITTFAIVAGVTGASLSTTIVLILGFANLVRHALLCQLFFVQSYGGYFRYGIDTVGEEAQSALTRAWAAELRRPDNPQTESRLIPSKAAVS